MNLPAQRGSINPKRMVTQEPEAFCQAGYGGNSLFILPKPDAIVCHPNFLRRVLLQKAYELNQVPVVLERPSAQQHLSREFWNGFAEAIQCDF
jgi:hypothetical protein